MTMLELRYFVEVVRQRGFTKAAENLFVTEPTISYHIKKLEKKVGTALLKRTTKYVMLTPEGELFYEQACITVKAYDALVQLAEGLSKQDNRPIRLGMTPILYEYYLKKELEQCRTDYFGDMLKFSLESEDHSLKRLQAKQIDFAIMRTYEFARDYFDPSLYATVMLFAEPVYLSLNPKLIKKNQTAVSLEELGEQPFFLTKEGDYFTHIRERLQMFCGCQIRYYNIRADDFSVLLSAVSEGKAVTLAGESIAMRLKEMYKGIYSVASLPIEPSFRQYILMVYLKDIRRYSLPFYNCR